MRTVVCKELGSLENLVIEERPSFEPSAGQVVVDVRAAGVNYVDGLICRGSYQMKPPTPYVPGGEISGVVAKVGSGVRSIAVGDRVMALTGWGAFSEQVLLSELSVHRIPDTIDFEQAAGFIQSYSTAFFSLRRAQLETDEWVLILGAGGGIGLASIDVALAMGAKVIAAASNEDKLQAARDIGAQHTISYETEDLKTRARELSDGGVDIVIDPVGGRHSEQALRATARMGRLCVIGFASGSIASVPLNQVLLNNRTVIGIDWGSWAFSDAEGNRQLLGELLEMVSDSKLHPPVPVVHRLENAATVMNDLLERRITGKVVLSP